MAKNPKFSARGYGTLWNRVSEVAEARGWDIATLAKEAKLDYMTVASLWNKDAKGAYFGTVHRLAAILDVQLGELFPVTDDEHPGDST